MQNQQILEDRIAELEMKTAFQEQLLDELNQALVQQQFDMDKIQLQLRYLAGKLKDMQPSNIASQSRRNAASALLKCNKTIFLAKCVIFITNS